MSSAEAHVLAANQAFYDAFARGSFAEVDALWAKRAPVACVHPGWDALHGRAEVIASFRSILENGAPTVTCTRPTAYVLGESAYVVCGEKVGDSELIATNLFVREDDAWRLVFHQAGPVHRRIERRSTPRDRGMLN